MKYVFKYIPFINFLLNKRDITSGGVDGISTPFVFSYQEVENELSITKQEVVNMLNTISNETIEVKSVIYSDTIRDVPVLSYKELENESRVEIKNSTTRKLINYRTAVAEISACSQIQIILPEKNRKIIYGNKEYTFNKADPFLILKCLHNNYRAVVTYDTLFKLTIKLTNKKFINQEANPSQIKKIQDATSYLIKVLENNLGIKAAIVNIKKEGYMLVV